MPLAAVLGGAAGTSRLFLHMPACFSVACPCMSDSYVICHCQFNIKAWQTGIQSVKVTALCTYSSTRWEPPAAEPGLEWH